MNDRTVILLVEDEPQQREVLEMLFSSEGYEVVGVASAEEALVRMESTRPDMIVTDVKLPEMDGFTLYEAILGSEKFRAIPFVFITGYNDPQAVERVTRLGAVAYVMKPYNLDDLLRVVKGIHPPNA
jgi:CheY-like chemotaxis protein